jgi:hypothetical protein
MEWTAKKIGSSASLRTNTRRSPICGGSSGMTKRGGSSPRGIGPNNSVTFFLVLLDVRDPRGALGIRDGRDGFRRDVLHAQTFNHPTFPVPELDLSVGTPGPRRYVFPHVLTVAGNTWRKLW